MVRTLDRPPIGSTMKSYPDVTSLANERRDVRRSELDFVEGCEECGRLSSAYEAATMEWFRLQGQLRIAEYSREKDASGRIVAELNATAKKRQALRDDVEAHCIAAHSRKISASNG